MISADDNLYSKFKFIEVTNSNLLQSIGDYYFDILIDGQRHGGAQFYLVPSDQSSMDVEQVLGGSCYALLKHLLSLENVELSPENLNSFLERNPEFLTLNGSQPSSQESSTTKHQLILSFGNGSNFCLFPTIDFAFTVLDGRVYGCTVSDIDNERLFFSIEFRNNVVDEQVVFALKSFMSNPVKALQQSAFVEKGTPSMLTASSPSTPITRKSSSTEGNHLLKDRRCLNCFCSSTPMWRRGPDGIASLCNACGVRYKHGKLVMDEATIEANKRRIKIELGLLDNSDPEQAMNI